MNTLSRRVTVVLAFLLLGAAAAAQAPENKAPGLQKGEIASLEIFDRDPASRVEELVFQTSDPERIEPLAAVIRSATPGRDHKCADTGVIVLHMKDGRAVRLGTLAGHDAAFWEYRLYSGEAYEVFRVDRGAFLRVLEQFGVRAKN